MEDGPAKPDPFPVTRAAELLGVNPEDTALVNYACNCTQPVLTKTLTSCEAPNCLYPVAWMLVCAWSHSWPCYSSGALRRDWLARCHCCVDSLTIRKRSRANTAVSISNTSCRGTQQYFTRVVRTLCTRFLLAPCRILFRRPFPFLACFSCLLCFVYLSLSLSGRPFSVCSPVSANGLGFDERWATLLMTFSRL